MCGIFLLTCVKRNVLVIYCVNINYSLRGVGRPVLMLCSESALQLWRLDSINGMFYFISTRKWTVDFYWCNIVVICLPVPYRSLLLMLLVILQQLPQQQVFAELCFWWRNRSSLEVISKGLATDMVSVSIMSQCVDFVSVFPVALIFASWWLFCFSFAN